jgi:glycosyltransferase involved in cell wall biosynthesis
METELTYALVTPLRDEAENLERLSAAIDRQTQLPLAWVIVDTGSTDKTLEVATALALTRPWVRVISVPAEHGRSKPAVIVRAFHAGLKELETAPSVIVKLDADTSMEPDHFERLLAAFAAEPRLGIASGTCLEQQEGRWEPVAVTPGHVRGAARAYRRECLEEVLPLEERVGWDGIDGFKATVRGWTTRMLPELSFYHHRPVGIRDGAPAAWWQAQGEAAYYMGYRFSYLLLRSLYRARRQPWALAMSTSYLAAAIRREPRCQDADVRNYVRRKQRLRTVALQRSGHREGI